MVRKYYLKDDVSKPSEDQFESLVTLMMDCSSSTTSVVHSCFFVGSTFVVNTFFCLNAALTIVAVDPEAF